jgi:transcriptional regulator with XRE-family HTH domain
MTDDLMTEQELADRARLERHRRRLTQADVAERINRSPQAVSKAENYSEGDAMTRLRIQIIEELTGKTVSGPMWSLQTAESAHE